MAITYEEKDGGCPDVVPVNIELLTKKTNKFAVLVVSLDCIIESPNNIMASWRLPTTEDNANPACRTQILCACDRDKRKLIC